MRAELSKPSRRVAVITNYSCTLLLLVFFSIGTHDGWGFLLIAGAAATAAAVAISFVFLHVRTGLWRLVHTKADVLDERQVQVTLESLRSSYAIFTVISLLVLMYIAFLAGRRDSILVLIFASLLYLAHTLPSSVIAWKEKEV